MPQADQFRHNVARMNRHAARAEAKLQRRARLRRFYYRVWSAADHQGDGLDCLVSNAPKPKRRYGHLIPGLAGIGLAAACFAVPGYLYYNAGHAAMPQAIAAVEQEQPASAEQTITAAMVPQAMGEDAAPAVTQASVAVRESPAPVEPEPVAIRGTLAEYASTATSVQNAVVPVGAGPAATSERRVRQIGPYAGHADVIGATLPYKLVHIANGRAMIEDEHGVTIVERGSRLPDNNQVEAIEQREGRWVMVTSADEILTATE